MSNIQSPLDNLAHIANMSRELLVLNNQIKEESPLFHETLSVPLSKSGKPKKVSCIECRQQKSKCDAFERHPEPCTRCMKKGHKCDIKTDYKRTYKRARIAQIEKEFSELKKTLSTSQAAELLRRIPTLSSSSILADPPDSRAVQDRAVSLSPYNDPREDELRVETPRVVIPPHALVCEEKSLDAVTFSPETIQNLFVEYVERYHPILPLVDVVKGPERIYKLCPALFWVIMFVAARRYRGDPTKHLLLTLSPIIKDILAEITISPITRYNPTEEDEPIINACSVYSVQAFLLYTFWPPITSSLSADSSWNTIGVALFQAIRIGLHSPSSLSDHSSGTKTPQQIAMAQEQAKTWVVCNIASQSIASAFGFPAFVQFDSSIQSMFRLGGSVQLPDFLQKLIEVAHFEDQISKTLNTSSAESYGALDHGHRLPLLKVLSRQLDDLEVKMAPHVGDPYLKFSLLTARVHLLTYYFMDLALLLRFELSKGLVGLYNAAIALINHAHLCQARDPLFVKYLPVVYIINIWQASCIIAKLAHSSLKEVVDIDVGKQSYQAAISLAAHASVLKHDIAYRSSGIMRNMWQLFRTLEEKNLNSLSINIRSRMSASVFFDCLFLLRDQVGMIKLNNRTENNGDNDDDGNSLDEEEAVVSEDEKEDPSDKGTPGGSSSSSRTKRQRLLSNTVNAESKARKIIRTIPLDPQPISAPGKRSNIFKVVNNSNDSSPLVKQDTTPTNQLSPVSNNRTPHVFKHPDVGNPEYVLTFQQFQPRAADSSRMAILGNSINRSQTKAPAARNATLPGFNGGHRYPNDNLDMMSEVVLNESPVQSLENLEMDSLDTDLLWKDVDSVMNDFGFHAQ